MSPNDFTDLAEVAQRLLGFSAATGRPPCRPLSDRLIDTVVAWGDLDAVAARIAEHLRAGADQVALSVVRAGPPATSRASSGGSSPRHSSPSLGDPNQQAGDKQARSTAEVLRAPDRNLV